MKKFRFQITMHVYSWPKVHADCAKVAGEIAGCKKNLGCQLSQEKKNNNALGQMNKEPI